MSTRNDLLQRIFEAITSGGSDVEIAYCDYEMSTPLALTATPTLVTGWAAKIPPKKITESAGRFTTAFDGVVKFDIERAYSNADTNPPNPVELTITVEKNGGTLFTRTLPISAATANDEPHIVAFTTPSLVDNATGDYYEIYVSASESGGEPEDCSLINIKVVADNAHNRDA